MSKYAMYLLDVCIKNLSNKNVNLTINTTSIRTLLHFLHD